MLNHYIRNKTDCESILKAKSRQIIPVFEQHIKPDIERILSCVYSHLRPVFVRQAIISYNHYPKDSVAFISDTSFTEGVLKFTERAGEGKIYDGNASLKTLVLSFCRMKLLEYLQQENRLSKKIKAFATDNAEDWDNTNESNDNPTEEQYQEIEQALAKMEEADRQIIVWKHLEQKTIDEIARLLAISKESAANRIYRCMRRLKQIIQDNKQ